jgi:ribose 5-phosphate isomerase B
VKTYTIITEADARVLERGTTVALAPGGHVTPLALDTLRERAITVVGSASAAVDLSALAPAAVVGRVALGGDHTAVAHTRAIRDHLRGQGVAVLDVGTDSSDPIDYPDVAGAVARLVARREADAGIVIDGAGLGSAMAANKVAGVRAAMCSSKTLARYAREHNGAHVLTLGSTLVSTDEALAIVDVFLSTATTEPRYLRRLAKLAALERNG